MTILSIKKSSKLSTLALALALSAGTVGGMMTFALTIEPAQARSAGKGGGGGGGAAGNGGEGGDDVMAAHINEPRSHARRPNNPPVARVRPGPQNCQQNTDGVMLQNCRYTQPRIVRINGFANCAVVAQVGPSEFACLRAM